MSVEDILREVPKLSPEELRQVARALCEALEDCKDIADVRAALEESGDPIPMAEIRKKYNL